MMGPRQEAQAAVFYEFSLEDHVPQDHLLRFIDRFVDLNSIRAHLADFYSHTGRPSVDPELLIRMLLVGYCFGIRSERRLCEEVHLNLAYRWVCRLDLTDGCQTIRPSRRTGMDVFVRANCCGTCLRRRWHGALPRAWSAASAGPPTVRLARRRYRPLRSGLRESSASAIWSGGRSRPQAARA